MKIIFAGTPDFSVPTLQALISSEHDICAVYTQPDRPAGRGRKIQFSPVKQCALSSQIPVEQPVNFKSPESLEVLARYQADLMIVVAYGIILPDNVLKAPRFGCINIHASLLPRWRGAAPIQRAILAGDKETGVTLMQMDKGLDTGDMLLKVSCPIALNDTSSSLHDKLAILGADALLSLLPQVAKRELTPKTQSNADVTYAHKLTKQEALIDWNQTASSVQRSIQGYNPWPVAHTLIDSKPLRIWQAETTAESSTLQPGQIKTEKNKLFVACTDYFLDITELQPANKRRMSASDYLSAHQVNNITLG